MRVKMSEAKELLSNNPHCVSDESYWFTEYEVDVSGNTNFVFRKLTVTIQKNRKRNLAFIASSENDAKQYGERIDGKVVFHD